MITSSFSGKEAWSGKMNLSVDIPPKEQVRNSLARGDCARLAGLCCADRRLWHALRLYLYQDDDDLRWPAIKTVGGVMKAWWREGRREKVREYLRSLLWQLNEESGNTGWNSPEVIAETIAVIPELLEPYGLNMLSFALESPALIDGSLWAIGRLGKQLNGKLDPFLARTLDAFNSANPGTLGLAARATGEAGIAPALMPLSKLIDRRDRIRIYTGDNFEVKSLGQWAREAISRIKRGPVTAPAGKAGPERTA
jgi:hypothetical protein